MLTVYKLGGSLLDGQALPACLDAVAARPGHKLIVPGGGLFAEQVRTMQGRYHFDDVAAHHMAILAMQQMALLINNLKPAFSLYDTVEKLKNFTGIGVWFPLIAELNQAGIPASWDVSSDSLAAWLSLQTLADELILIKSATIAQDDTLLALQAQGILDAAFNQFAAQLACPIIIMNKHCFISPS